MVDKILYLYSTIVVSLLVLGSALNASRGPSTLIVGILFIPVAGYLIINALITLKHRPAHSSSSIIDQIFTKHRQPSLKASPTHNKPTISLGLILTILFLTTAITSLILRLVLESKQISLSQIMPIL